MKKFKWIELTKETIPLKVGGDKIYMVTGYDGGKHYYYWASAHAYGYTEDLEKVFSVPGWSKMNVSHYAEIPKL